VWRTSHYPDQELRYREILGFGISGDLQPPEQRCVAGPGHGSESRDLHQCLQDRAPDQDPFDVGGGGNPGFRTTLPGRNADRFLEGVVDQVRPEERRVDPAGASPARQKILSQRS
jgi:hypothetical protein